MRYDFGKASFELKNGFDFSFLNEFDEVFKVFDQQDSGNLCFGVRKGEEKYFLKLAGAEPVRSSTPPVSAVERLLGTIPVYEALRHPGLINLLDHKPVPGGELLIFEWFDGACMGRMYGQFDRFIALPAAEKLNIYRTILDFHEFVNEKGYVAIDFYDGSVMYDFLTKEARLCDIEFYAKMPYVNRMGRMWGSGRYMSPEEFTLGAEIDARTNVFNMGAMAFQLFGGGIERKRGEWQLDDGRFEIALRATAVGKAERFGSIAEFIREWENA